MSKKLVNLREARNKSVVAARAILDLAEGEKRELTADEQGQWDAHMDDQQNSADSIGREERAIAAERDLAGQHFESEENNDENRGKAPVHVTATPEYRAAHEKFLRLGKDHLSADEARALSAGDATEGGYLVMPQQMVSGLLKNVDDAVYIRQKATVHQLPQAASLGVPTLDTDPSDPIWTAEIATGSEDSSMALGKRELSPNPLAKRIKISNKLLRMVPGIEALVMQRLGVKFGRVQESAFMTGSGANQPLGLFTASDNGIPTSRDMSTGNAATAFTFDGLINAKYNEKEQYQKVAEWLFHRDAVKMLAKLKDGEGQYIWEASKKVADPDMLLGRPVTMSEFVPNTFTSGLYVGIFGDLSKYWIADAMNVQIQRLVELYAEANQTGFIGRLECDGMPTVAEAFTRVKLG